MISLRTPGERGGDQCPLPQPAGKLVWVLASPDFRLLDSRAAQQLHRAAADPRIEQLQARGRYASKSTPCAFGPVAITCVSPNTGIA
jgi:hypothetical protein